MPDDAVALAFLERLTEDRRRGAALPLAAYQALFPGFEHAVADAYAYAMAAPSRSPDDPSAATLPPASRAIDEQIGPYLLVEELGRGGQGIVYRARDTRVDRLVALKVLSGIGLESDDARRRFQREATIASRLAHANICTVYEADTEDGVPYIAMEVVEGMSLARLIAASKAEETSERPSWIQLSTEGERAPASAAESNSPTPGSPRGQELTAIVEVIEKTARALHYAHESGIIHRDLKPGNIMITSTGEPLLMDFGLARLDAVDQPTLTATGDLLGTPAYMSPEQISGQRIPLDRRSDVYSLGVALYESLTLRRPFDAPTREGLYQAVLAKEPLDPRKVNQEISSDLKVVIETALAKDRDRRYQTALDLADDLRRVRMREPIAARPIGPVGRAARWARRRPARAALAIVLLLGIPVVTALGSYVIATRPQVEARRQQQLADQVERLLEEGFFEYGHGSPRKAEAAFAAAFEKMPSMTETVAGLALSHLKLGRPHASLKLLETSGPGTGDEAALTPILVHVLRALGRDPEAEVLASRSVTPETPVALFLAAHAHIDVGHSCEETSDAAREAYDDARQLIHQAILSAPAARRVYHFGLAHVIGHLGHAEEVHQLAGSLRSLWPGSAAAHYWRGYSLADSAAATATAAYREAIRLDPGRATYHYNLGTVLRRQEHFDEAIAAYREAVRLNPESAFGFSSLGWTLRQQGRADEAVTAITEAIRLEPDNPTFHHDLAVTLAQQKRLDAASIEFREAIRLDSEHADAHNGLGSVLKGQGHLDQAAAACREAIRLEPDNALFHYNLGLVLAHRGQLDAAIRCLREAVRLDPRDAGFQSNLGAFLSQRGHRKEAITAIREAIRLDPNQARYHVNLGAAHTTGGHHDEAIAAFREAIRLDPDLRQARFNLGVALEEQGHIEEAVAAYRASARLDPQHARSQRKLRLGLRRLARRAHHAFRQGDVAEAVSLQERLLELMAGEDAGDYTFDIARKNLARFQGALDEDL